MIIDYSEENINSILRLVDNSNKTSIIRENKSILSNDSSLNSKNASYVSNNSRGQNVQNRKDKADHFVDMIKEEE